MDGEMTMEPMQQPIEMELPCHVKDGIRSVRLRPAWCRYPVAHAGADLIPLAKAPILRQHIKDFLFFMQLLESEVKIDTCLHFTVPRPTAFLLFVLEGDMPYRDERGQLVADGREMTYYLCYFHGGTFSIQLDRGPYRVLAVSLHSGWLVSQAASYPAFRPVTEAILQGAEGAVPLPLCYIGQRMTQHLERIRTFADTDDVARVTGIFHVLTQILGIYHRLIGAGQCLQSEVHDIQAKVLEDYIAANYTAEIMHSLTDISMATGIPEWKIRKLSPKLFGKSLRGHVTDLRMGKAFHLLENTAMRIREISAAIGFNDPHYFYQAFKRYYGICPRAARKGSEGSRPAIK